MGSVSSLAAGEANLGSEGSFRVSEGSFGTTDRIMAVCRRLWPVKTAAQLAFRCEVSQRQAEFWLAGQHNISLSAAQRLLHSEHGYLFLVELMRGSDAGWWHRVQISHETGNVRRQLKASQRKLERLREQQQELELD